MRGVSWLWLGAVIAALLYGSLLPFKFDTQSISGRFDIASIGRGLKTVPFEDLLTNLLVYMPVGLALILCGKGHRLGRSARLPIAVMLGGGIGFLSELLQTGLAARVSSWLDVVLNAAGAGFGAVLGILVMSAGPGLFRALRARYVQEPFATTALVFSLGLFLYHLAPFDFITTTEALRASFLASKLDFVVTRPFSHQEPQFAVLIDQLTRAVWFAALGAVYALGQRERLRDPIVSFLSAVKNTFILIVLIELLKLFTASHVFELAAVILTTLAAIFGAWVAIFLVDKATRSQWRRDPRLAVPTLLLIAAVLFQVMVVFLSELGIGSWSIQSATAPHFHWLPFEELRFGSMRHSFEEVLMATVRYATFAVTLAVTLRRLGVLNVWSITGVATVLLALVSEFLHGATVSGTTYLTNPVIAVVVVALVVQTVRVMESTNQSDDPAFIPVRVLPSFHRI